uniref:Peptidase S8/S53 domain-containing protein n=2 Tax=Kalanchoe fedtschenkoi TaxID=63787 RepID=A0A7N0UL27_KALFE
MASPDSQPSLRRVRHKDLLRCLELSESFQIAFTSCKPPEAGTISAYLPLAVLNQMFFRKAIWAMESLSVFSTQVLPESRAFSDNGLGPIPKKWKGACVSGQAFNSSHCNKKIIGARYFVSGIEAEYGLFNTSGGEEYMSPRDANGHGTHTASTAAGSSVGNVSYKGLARGTLRGGAPRARLAVYKVCWNVGGGQCASADMLKAFDEAIHDGVDVLSLSIGGSIPVFADVDERDGIATGSYHAVANGITVVCAAGNAGPAAYNVQNTAPWILTVAASSVDRLFYTPVTLGNNKTYVGEALYVGKTVGFKGFVYPEGTDLEPTANSLCEDLRINQTLASGKVVLCFTSTVGRSPVARAARAVSDAGGVGVIVAKSKIGTLAACTDDFPCIEVDYEAGTQMLFYIRSTGSPVVKLSPSRTVVGKPVTARVAYFSARGPSHQVIETDLVPCSHQVCNCHYRSHHRSIRDSDPGRRLSAKTSGSIRFRGRHYQPQRGSQPRSSLRHGHG